MALASLPYSSGIKKNNSGFNPYDDNGGYVLQCFLILNKKIQNINLLRFYLKSIPRYFYDRSIVAIGGDNYLLIASDTRLSTGYSIYTRNQSKLFKVSNKSIVGSSGCWCDSLTLTRLMNARMQVL